MNATRQLAVARGLAFATGIVTLLSVGSLALFFTVGKPFGAINDWTVGLAGLLTGFLAMALPGVEPGRPRRAVFGTAAAVAGAAIVVVGALVVISATTGFLLAGLVESVGFAFIGVWLVSLNWSLRDEWPRRLRNLGIAAGIVMALGFVVVPGVLMGIDNADTAPGWIWLGFVGWLGIFFLYPFWSLWLGTVARTESIRARSSDIRAR